MNNHPPEDAIRCDACPVLCYIRPGRTGACDRYGNRDGQLVRLDPHVVLDRAVARGESVVPFLQQETEWDGSAMGGPKNFVTAIGAGTTYPDYKPAPFIISSQVEGVDMVTVVTEGIFSYCGVKVKIDTDRHLGPETSLVRAQGEAVGHVTTSEYGSQMLSLGGVRHLTGGSRREGTVTCEALLNLCNGQPVELQVEGGAKVIVQAGKGPVVDGQPEVQMRVGCGSDLMDIGEELGELLTQRAVAALGIDPHTAESYGKAAAVGENGEIEHAAAVLHPKLGTPVRRVLGKGAALIPSSKKRGGMGVPLDIPLGHKDAAFVRSHFDGMEVRINDAPRANEILVAVAVTDSGRPLARVGGLTKDKIKGEDGLR